MLTVLHHVCSAGLADGWRRVMANPGSAAPARVVTTVVSVRKPPVFVAAAPAKAVTPAVTRAPASTVMVARPVLATTFVAARPATAPTRVLTPQLTNVRLIDPAFARDVNAVQPQVRGVVRSQLKDPVAPTPAVTDEVLFEAPANAAQKYYLPRYRVAQQNASGVQQYQMAFEPSGTGFALTIRLEKFVAPTLQQAAHTAHEVDHHVAVLLRHALMINGRPGSQEELAFQEITLLPDGAVHAVLH